MSSLLARTARSAVAPAPVGGWNARDPLPAMKATDAVILENMIPGPEGVKLRGGTSDWVSGLGAQVSSLLRYSPPNGAPHLFACAGGSIFDATNEGGPVPVLTGLAGDKWRGVNFGTPGGAFLVAANGADAPRKFDGLSWSAVALVAPQAAVYGSVANPVAFTYPYALDPTRLKSPVVFGQRLWFIERASLRVWFLPVNAIGSSAQIAPAAGGAVPDLSLCAQALDFSSQCRLGGSLAAMAVWTRDGGAGSDDYAVFITTAGEVIVYAGTDPTSAAAWSRVGVFSLPPPIGDRCVLGAGADVAVLTETGVLPLSSALPLTLSQDAQVTVTDKIRGAFGRAYSEASTAFGWQIAEYPMGGLLIVNVPDGDGGFGQFVMNVLTQGWCSFAGIPASCWELLGDWLMFGTPDGRVVRYDTGAGDNGVPIPFAVLPAFSAFKILGRKRFTMARPLYVSALGYRPAVRLLVDYDTTRPTITTPPLTAYYTPWFSPWYSAWGPALSISAVWQGVRGTGRVASPYVAGASVYPFRLDQIDLQFEPVGDLL